MTRYFIQILLTLTVFSLLFTNCNSEEKHAVRFFHEPHDTLNIKISRELGKNGIHTSSSTDWFNIQTSRDARIVLDTGVFIIKDKLRGNPHLDIYNSQSGELLHSLQNTDITNIALCQKTDRLAILYQDNQVEIRDYELKLISSYQLQGKISAISLTHEDLIVSKWPKERSSEGYIITEQMNLRSGSITPLLFLDPAYKSKYRTVKSYVSSHSSMSVFAPFISNKLFFLGTNGEKSTYQLDFGAQQPDLEVIVKSSEDPYYFARENNWLYGIDEILSTDQYIYLKGLTGSGIFQLVFDYHNQKSRLLSLRNDINITHVLGNQFVGIQRRSIEGLPRKDITHLNQLKINYYEFID